MKRLFLFLAIFLSISLVSALDMSANLDSNIIVRDFENTINLTIDITNATPGDYNIYTLADVNLEPRQIFNITEENITKPFTISPASNLDVEGYYTITYTLNHRGVEKIDKKLTINLVNLEDIIEVSSESIDPDSGVVEFYVENKENVELKNITAEFSSILFEIEETFDLKPNEKLFIPVDVDKKKLSKTKAGVYVIESVFQTKEGEKIINGNLYLGETKGISTVEGKSGIFIQTQTITKTNVGNVLETVQIRVKRNIISRLFTSFNIEPIFTERHGFMVEYTWVKERLSPTEVYIVKARTNYIFPFLVVVFVILLIIGFKRFSETKLEVKKSVSHVKTKSGEFALRVRLAVKARKNVENVTLIDKVPAIVKIYNKFGTTKPDKIDLESRRLHWHIGDLDVGEERMFSYIIYSKVGVVGKFSLPEALAVFEKEGKIHEINSNSVYFMSDQIRKE